MKKITKIMILYIASILILPIVFLMGYVLLSEIKILGCTIILLSGFLLSWVSYYQLKFHNNKKIRPSYSGLLLFKIKAVSVTTFASGIVIIIYGFFKFFNI